MSQHSEHWNGIYTQRSAESLSWFQANASLSLELIDAMQLPKDAPIIDIGTGVSRLSDALLDRGYSDLTLLDVSERALDSVRQRVAPRTIQTVVADVTAWKPARRYALWHDRAVFHFLTPPQQRAAYRNALLQGLAARAHVIIATFSLDGPERCSGLPVQRYGVEQLADEFGELLSFVAARHERHVTPAGAEQSFVYAHFIRR